MDKKKLKTIALVLGFAFITLGVIRAGFNRHTESAVERITSEGGGYIRELGKDQRGAAEGVDRLKGIIGGVEAGTVQSIERIDNSIGLAGQSAELIGELRAILGELERRSPEGAGAGR